MSQAAQRRQQAAKMLGVPPAALATCPESSLPDSPLQYHVILHDPAVVAASVQQSPEHRGQVACQPAHDCQQMGTWLGSNALRSLAEPCRNEHSAGNRP